MKQYEVLEEFVMAFHNTSDRYKYIYGSNVTKLDTIEDYDTGVRKLKPESQRTVRKQNVEKRPAQKTKVTNPETEAAIQKNRARFLEFDWKYTLVTAAAIMICAVSCLAYVGGTVHLNNLSAQVSALKTQKAELESKQAALQAEIDKNINLDEIRTFAEKELHMIYPDPDHMIYYTDGTSDYFRQYESVDVSK